MSSRVVSSMGRLLVRNSNMESCSSHLSFRDTVSYHHSPHLSSDIFYAALAVLGVVEEDIEDSPSSYNQHPGLSDLSCCVIPAAEVLLLVKPWELPPPPPSWLPGLHRTINLLLVFRVSHGLSAFRTWQGWVQGLVLTNTLVCCACESSRSLW